MGEKCIKDIKSTRAQGLYNELVKRDVKSNAVKKTTNILYNALRQAVRDDLLLENSCEAADIPETEGEERRVLATEKQQEFIDLVADSVKWKRYYSLFIVAFGTDMRIEELLTSHWNDLDSKEKSIRVNRALQYI